jgi:GTP-binding protein
MKIKEASFVCSSSKNSQCPKPDMPEYAFIGRSNVGKSSLINALTDNKGLAKTSGTPGKTQLINHFIVNKTWYLVDLPGLGYAKTAKSNRENWEKMIQDYLLKRVNLFCTFILVDSRHEPQKIDLELMTWFGANQLPFCLVFTKTDKVKPVELQTNIENYKVKLLEEWEELPDIFITSAEKKLGLDDILKFIDKTNSVYIFNKQG